MTATAGTAGPPPPGGYDPLDPPVDEVTAPWWDATRERRLLLQECAACGHAQHPPRTLCTACGHPDALGWRRASGAGRVDSATVVQRAPHPRFVPPYVVARIRLAEGPIVLSAVEPLGDDVRPGGAVRLDWRPLPDGRALPIFRLEQEE